MTDEQRQRGLRLFQRDKGRRLEWTEERKAWLREVYTDNPQTELSEVTGLGRKTLSTYAWMFGLGRKTREQQARAHAYVTRRRVESFRRMRRNLKWGIFGTGVYSEGFRRLTPMQRYCRKYLPPTYGYKVVGGHVTGGRFDERRFNIYYTPDTRRRPKLEATCLRYGLRVLPWEGEA